MVVEVGTADKLDKVEEDRLIGGVLRRMSGYQVKDQRDGQEGIANDTEDEGGAKEQEDFQVDCPPKMHIFQCFETGVQRSQVPPSDLGNLTWSNSTHPSRAIN